MFSPQLAMTGILYFKCTFVCVCVCIYKKFTGHFDKGVAEGAVHPSFNPVLALRLSVLKDSAVWAILSEVSQSLVNVQSSHMTTNTIHLAYVLYVQQQVMLFYFPVVDTYKENCWLNLLEQTQSYGPV